MEYYDRQNLSGMGGGRGDFVSLRYRKVLGQADSWREGCELLTRQCDRVQCSD